MIRVFWEFDRRQVFEAMTNAIILHQFQICYNFELLMSKEVGDWVNDWSMT
jgi:hypothetical protein